MNLVVMVTGVSFVGTVPLPDSVFGKTAAVSIWQVLTSTARSDPDVTSAFALVLKLYAPQILAFVA